MKRTRKSYILISPIAQLLIFQLISGLRGWRLKIKKQNKRQYRNFGVSSLCISRFDISHDIISICDKKKSDSSCDSLLRKKKKKHKGKKHVLHHKLPFLSIGRHSYLRLSHVRAINISFQPKNLTIKIYL